MFVSSFKQLFNDGVVKDHVSVDHHQPVAVRVKELFNEQVAAFRHLWT